MQGQGNSHLAGLLGEIGRIGDPVPCEDHFCSGSLYLREVRGVIGKEKLVIILSDNLGLGVKKFQTVFESFSKDMAEAVVLQRM